MPGANWLTPVAFQRNREQVWKKLEDRSVQPPKLDLEKEITYFNNVTKFQPMQQYDIYFAYTKSFPLWDKRKSRDNRRYLPDIHENIFQQEKNKPVPALTSMTYGRNISYETNDATFRRQHAIADFERRRGIINELEDNETV